MDILKNMKKAVKALTEKLNVHIKSALGYAENNKKLVKIAGATIGIIACSVFMANFFTTGYEVYLGDEKIAVVEEKEDFVKAYDAANASIVAIAGKGTEIFTVPQYVVTVAPKTSISGFDAMKESVMMKSDAVSLLYFINVDGYDITSAKTEKEAKALLEKASSGYEGKNKKILNTVEIVNRFGPVYLMGDDDSAVTKLVNVLKVQTEKTEKYQAELLYGRIENPTEAMYVDEQELVTSGENGIMEVTAKIVSVNGVASGAETISTKGIKEPVSEVVMVGTTERPSVGTGTFVQPFYGIITSRYGARWGRTHKGTDIAGDVGSPVKVADNGIVTTSEYQENGYGNIIIVDHQNGINTWYAHLNASYVEVGDVVEKGMVIGEVGNTGFSTGPHLHFEVRENGVPVDPGKYLEGLQ